ncbi:MAG: protein kinase domain-containing protein [Terriglobales bacterium]
MAAPSQLVGHTLGHYQILGEAGSGGMGVVYRARDERLDRIVALKVLPTGALQNENVRKRFRNEALTLAKLNHPHIATIHDFDSQQGIDFLVMEYVDGVTLADKLLAGPLPQKTVISLGTQIASTLEYAHQNGVIHRDLKPGNVMVTPQGQVKLLDFGLARLAHAGDSALTESATEIKHAGGTLPYMAPEQLRGVPADERTDIYAAGSTLYEMATGKRPFPQQDTPELITAILHEDPVPPREVNKDLSPLLEAAIVKAMDKDPDHRYQSAKELRVDLLRLDMPRSTRLTPVPEKRRWHPAWLLVLLPVLLAFAYWLSSQPPKPQVPTTPRQVLVADFENRTGDPDFDNSLSTALSTYLEQSNAVTIFPPSRQRAAVHAIGDAASGKVDANVGSRICVREGIPLLITGEISRVKDEYLLAVRVLNPSDQRVLMVHTEQAPQKNAVLSALGSAAREVRLDIGEQRLALEKSDKLPEQITTSSLRALQLYSLARNEHLNGNYDAAIALYTDAIRHDPEFALAYARLSTVYRNLGDRGSARSNMDEAIRLLDHVTDRERYTLLGLSAAYDEDYQQAVDNLLVLTKLYPEDANGHFYLALCFLLQHKLDDALVEANKATKLDPSPQAYNNLAEVLLAQNKFQEVVDLLHANPPLQYEGGLVKAYLGLGQIDKAQEEVDRLLATHDEQAHARAAEAQLKIYLMRGEWDKAGNLLQQTGAVGKDPVPTRVLTLAALALQKGGRSQAGTLLRNAESQIPATDSLYAAFPVLASQAGESRLTAKVLRAVDAKLEKRNIQRLNAYRDLLRGAMALNDGQSKKAVTYLQSARTNWDDILVRDSYAHALLESGQWADAEREFREISQLRGLALGDNPVALIVWKSSPYWLARTLEAAGDRTQSERLYREFLQGWPSGQQRWTLTQDAARRLQSQHH